jgi:hypothetical protein
MSNFLKILPVEAELLYEDGQTDMTKLIVAFRSFASEPKNVQSILKRNEYQSNKRVQKLICSLYVICIIFKY